MDRMLSCYLDKMVESPHFSLPAFRNYVKNKAREIMTKRKRAQLVGTGHDLSKTPGRKLLSIPNIVRRLWNQPQNSEIIYGRRIKEGNDMPNNRAEETETQKLHRYVVHQRSHPGPIVRPTQPPDVTPSTKKNYTNVKPTFEEFLEFVLDTDLQGKRLSNTIFHGKPNTWMHHKESCSNQCSTHSLVKYSY